MRLGPSRAEADPELKRLRSKHMHARFGPIGWARDSAGRDSGPALREWAGATWGGAAVKQAGEAEALGWEPVREKRRRGAGAREATLRPAAAVPATLRPARMVPATLRPARLVPATLLQCLRRRATLRPVILVRLRLG
jgi:hypothetical protein